MSARALFAAAVAAALLLAAAELTTIASVDVANESCEVINDSSPELADRCELSGWERHGGAMLVLALVAFGAALYAGRPGARATGSAVLVVVGVIALAITLIGDLPETGETGAIGRDFDGATAQAGLGFFLELIGGVLCVAAGVLGLVRGDADGRAGPRPRAGRPSASAPRA